MATTINYPYQITTLSAKGSAEVIARGITNDYITEWSYNTNTIGSWDRVADFPTVVRTGNFVWCWYREYLDRAIYVLIDVVPDPQVEYQLGNNIAYPALLNGSVGEITYAVTPANIKTINTGSIPGPDNSPDLNTVTDGPYYKLAVGNKYVHVTGTTAGYKAGFYNSDRSYKEIVADKWGRTPNVWRGFATANATYVPWVIGWGTSQSLLTSTNTDDGDTIYGIFAPFATYEQFQTLYGAEKDWIYSTSGSSYKTLFGSTYDTSNNAGIQYTNTSDIENDYPFTVEEMQPQTNYRDIPGDTNQDGIDDSTSFEDALATYAVAASVFPGLDITKCGNLADLSIKLPGIDLPSINELKNTVKAGIDTAVSSTGLLELGKKLEGFKAGLKDKLPKVPQIENLAKDISDLKDASEDELSNLKKKWENAVEDIEGIIDDVRNLGGFDVCQFVTDKAKTDEDGNLVKKPDLPTLPEDDIEEFERGVLVPQSNAQLPQDEVQQSTGIVEAAAREARVEYDNIWKKFLQDPFIYEAETADITFKEKTLQQQISETVSTTDGRVGAQNDGLSLSDSGLSISDIIGIKDPQSTVNSDPLKVKVPDGVGYKNKQALISRKEQLLKDPNYQKLKTSGAGYGSADVPLQLTEFEIFAKNYRIEFTDKLLASAREQISAKLFKSNDIESISAVIDSQSTELWSPPEYIKAGAIYPNSISALVTENEVELFKKITTIIHTFIDNNILTEEVLQLAVTITGGTISANTERNTNTAGNTMLPNWTPEGEGGSTGAQGEVGDATFEANVSLKAVNYKDITGSVIYDYSSGTIRNKPVQPELLSILEKTSNQGGYKFVIYSGGQDLDGRGNRRTGSKRHDAGYAADIRVYNKNGRRISAAGNSRDINELQDCVVLLLQNGISSVGAHRYYMNGNLHVDISNRGPWRIGPAIWGNNHRSNTAPQWLRNIFY